MKLNAKWINDCQGKKDYDGCILAISTRYWPAGGGFTFIHRENDHITWQDGIEGIKPSAKSSLIIRGKKFNTNIELISKEFEGVSFEEIASQVEAWAQEQMDKVIKILLSEFGSATLQVEDGGKE